VAPPPLWKMEDAGALPMDSAFEEAEAPMPSPKAEAPRGRHQVCARKHAMSHSLAPLDRMPGIGLARCRLGLVLGYAAAPHSAISFARRRVESMR
jgi:hypothetical protein